MIAGGYCLHLYCMNSETSGNENPTCKNKGLLISDILGEFNGKDLVECKNKAKKQGWKFTKNDVICPHCMKDRNSIGRVSISKIES